MIFTSCRLFPLGLLLLLLEQLINFATCLWAIPGSRCSILFDNFFTLWLFNNFQSHFFVAFNWNDFDFNFGFFDLLFDGRIFKRTNVVDFGFNIGFFSFGFVFGNEIFIIYIDCGYFNWNYNLSDTKMSSSKSYRVLQSLAEFCRALQNFAEPCRTIQRLTKNSQKLKITFLWHRNNFLRGSYGSHPPACQGQAVHLWCQSLHCFNCWSLFHCIVFYRHSVKGSIL